MSDRWIATCRIYENEDLNGAGFYVLGNCHNYETIPMHSCFLGVMPSGVLCVVERVSSCCCLLLYERFPLALSPLQRSVIFALHYALVTVVSFRPPFSNLSLFLPSSMYSVEFSCYLQSPLTSVQRSLYLSALLRQYLAQKKAGSFRLCVFHGSLSMLFDCFFLRSVYVLSPKKEILSPYSLVLYITIIPPCAAKSSLVYPVPVSNFLSNDLLSFYF